MQPRSSTDLKRDVPPHRGCQRWLNCQAGPLLGILLSLWLWPGFSGFAYGPGCPYPTPLPVVLPLATHPTLFAPTKWCGIAGSPSIDDPLGPAGWECSSVSDVLTVLWRRHERASDSTWIPQAQITLRAGPTWADQAPYKLNYTVLSDTTTPVGVPGDVVIQCSDPFSPICSGPLEIEQLWAQCQAYWNSGLLTGLGTNPKGVLALSANHLVDETGTELAFGMACVGSLTSPCIVVADPRVPHPTFGYFVNERPLASAFGQVLGLPAVSDPANLMDPSGNGAALTAAQALNARTLLASNSVIDPPLFSSNRVALIIDRPNDDAPLPWVDMKAVMVVDDSPTGGSLRLASAVRRPIPRDTNFALFFLIDADNNIQTGGTQNNIVPGDPMVGADFIGRVVRSGSNVVASLFRRGPLGNFVVVSLPAGGLTAEVREAEYALINPVKGFRGKLRTPAFTEIELRLSNQAVAAAGLDVQVGTGRDKGLFPRGLRLQSMLQRQGQTGGFDFAPATAETFGEDAVLRFPQVEFPSLTLPDAARPGEVITLRVERMHPNSPLKVFLGDSPVLVDAKSDANGNATIRVTIPLDFAPGPRLVTVGQSDPPLAVTADGVINILPADLVITSFEPRTAKSGELIRIKGLGFGQDPDRLCALIMDGNRSIPLIVRQASATELIAELGPVPPDAKPGPIMIQLGDAVRSRFKPIFDDLEVLEPAWLWVPRGPMATTEVVFTPVPIDPPTNTKWFTTPQPVRGVLRLPLGDNWCPGARVTVSGRVRHHSPTGGGDIGVDFDTPERSIRFNLPAGASAAECARRICDVLVCGINQLAEQMGHPEVIGLVACDSDGEGTVFVTMQGGIDWGHLTVCIECPRTEFEFDDLPNTSALVGLQMPDGSLVNLILNGPTKIKVNLLTLEDVPANGLEEVSTELLAMNLSGSGFQLVAGSANGLPATLGDIEENQNVRAGRLDLPGPDAPFCTSPVAADCVGRTATSRFNVMFAVILPDGRRLHNVEPLLMQSTITEKPPRAVYTHVITRPIELFDENNRGTGVFLVKANHDTRPKEIDRYETTGAVVGLRMADGSLVNLVMTGPTTIGVGLDTLSDTPANGLEEVDTEMLAMNLTDIWGRGYQLIAGSANGLTPTLGEIEETANVRAGRLDLPGPEGPFCTSPLTADCVGRTAISRFNVMFAVITPDGRRLHNRVPLRMESTITEKPPRTIYKHIITDPIPLLDDNNNATGIVLVSANHDTRLEVDHLANTSALVGLQMPDGSLVNVVMNGPTTIAVDLTSLSDTPGNGLEEVNTEMWAMNLSGSGFQLVAGTANGLPATLGDIEENQNVRAGRLDLPGPDAPFCTSPVAADCVGRTATSRFNVMFAVILPDGRRLHNVEPLLMQSTITEKPPRAVYTHVITRPIELFDENNRGTGVFLVKANHDTRPKEIDRYETTGAVVGLRMADGSLVNLVMTGPTTIGVGLDTLSDTPANGLEEVDTEMLAMNLTDIWGRGYQLIAGSANGLTPTLGEIEETANVRAGRLDLPGPEGPFCTSPLTADCVGRTAISRFNVMFAVITPDGRRLHNRVPLRMESTITEKPPRTIYKHIITDPIPLLDDNNNATGIVLVSANHDTRLEVDHLANTSALVGLQMPDGSLVNVVMNGPTTIAVDLTSLSDTPGNGLEEVNTEMWAMNLSGSGFQLVAGTANGLPATLGDIEENQNVRAGRLDLPGPDAPFCTSPVAADCVGRTATSRFNVMFAVILPDGRRLHNVEPLLMQSTITEKPPRAVYTHVITRPIELFDENNRGTGVFLVKANHDTRPKEIDRYETTGAVVGLRMADGSLVNLVMTGPTTIGVGLDTLSDTPANGLEEVDTEMLAMNLTDIWGRGYQLIAGSANGLTPTLGEIEETANVRAGRLDLPGPEGPFCTSPLTADCVGRTAISRFNVMFKIVTPDGTELHNAQPLLMQSTITEKPPRTIYSHVITRPIELLDANNRPTGVTLVTANHNTRPREIDRYETTGAVVGLKMADGSLVNLVMTGPTTIAVELDTLADLPANGREEVRTEMLAMNLVDVTGRGFLLTAGSANGLAPSLGRIEENQNVRVGRLDLPGPDEPFCTSPLAADCVGKTATSWFDVLFEVKTPDGRVLHNQVPLRMESEITEKPPRTIYRHIVTQPIDLLDANNRPTGIQLIGANHDTRQEIDRFENTSALVGLRMPNGNLVNAVLNGPATIAVNLTSLADNPANGLEEVDTELVAMNLSGNGFQLVAGVVNGLPASSGQIEELVNIRPGRLDLPGLDPPFCTDPVAADCVGARAKSWFDIIFAVILPDGRRLHNQRALRMESVITHKPPSSTYTHVITQPIELFDDNNQPTRVFLVTADHTTPPPGCPLVHVVLLPDGAVRIWWQELGSSGCRLRCKDNILSTDWRPVLAPYAFVDGTVSVTIPPAERARFYRLFNP